MQSLAVDDVKNLPKFEDILTIYRRHLSRARA
jgi:hypothetical protein